MIDNVAVVDGVLLGRASLSGTTFDVRCDPEAEDGEIVDLDVLRQQAETSLARLAEGRMRTLIHDLVREVTDAAYEQSDHAPSDKDYRELERDLRLQRLDCYVDGAVLLFGAETVFPDMEVACQVGIELDIEDVAVDWRRP